MPTDYISRLNLDGTTKPIRDGSNFIGTSAKWDSLTDEEKASYKTYDITDDYTGALAVTEDDFIVIDKTLYFPHHPQPNS